MRVDFNLNNSAQTMRPEKALEKAVQIPGEMLNQMLSLQQKLLAVNVQDKLLGNNVDTYA